MKPSSSSSESEETLDQQKIHDLLGRCLKLFNRVYEPFLRQALIEQYGPEGWQLAVQQSSNKLEIDFTTSSKPFSLNRTSSDATQNWDTQNIISIILRHWNDLFAQNQRNLTNAEKSFLFEVRTCRNKWAHQNFFTLRDTYHYVDAMQRLIEIFPDKTKEIEEIDKMRNYTLLYLANEVKRAQQRKEKEKHKREKTAPTVVETTTVSASPNVVTSQNISSSSSQIIPQEQPIYSNFHSSSLMNQMNPQQQSVSVQTKHYSTEQQHLVFQLSEYTGLTHQYALMCLEEAQWAPQTALELFTKAKEQGLLPSEAFIAHPHHHHNTTNHSMNY
ncbi:hypothetical protein C9374_003181 [Naegleria lovaniensis]|uniref:TAP-C domain-containing protein n=1 Tax=Naegleria lovaniensis TaxID=51637 RepID=A0AA88GNR2_NAELO|nr:uncharacterized protein C9374_003181 [Naegleria lovaniensis]KAG2386032.1 hypothetical protein C9374_003181 [Naegleria lovaniensis]